MASATQSLPVIPRDEVPFDRFYRLSVDQYRQMGAAGILTKNDGVELLEGVIYVKHPRSCETSERFYRLSVDQYRRMAELGILTEDDSVELLEGWLIAKMTINPSHRIATRWTRVALEGIVPAGWYVDQQNPISTGDSEPEPDVSVVRAETDDDRGSHPGPRDVALVVEVAGSSLREDRRLKKQLYARAAIPIYWIVNLVDGRIEVYTDPTGPADQPDYRHRQDFGPSDMLPVVIEGREVGRIAVRDLLP